MHGVQEVGYLPALHPTNAQSLPKEWGFSASSSELDTEYGVLRASESWSVDFKREHPHGRPATLQCLHLPKSRFTISLLDHDPARLQTSKFQ